jgi:hypothetical protein
MRSVVLFSFLSAFILSAFMVEAAIPPERAFVNPKKFERLVKRGMKEQWAKLPIGDRTARIGLALVDTPYVNFTLELDDRHETPCVNMDGMDCWTFFEIALGTARAFSLSDQPAPRDLLKMIELERYRGGKCDGTFVSRLHHLEDWSYDNAKRGLIEDLTPSLPGAKKLVRQMEYMGKNWKSFRQLRANPKLVPAMQKIEDQISRRGIHFIPKAAVPSIEKYLQNGDVISIVTTWPGTYTSHVGLAYRDKKGVLRFMHASRNHRKVLVDERLSTYLNNNSKHMGIMVARPRDVSAPRS